MAHVVHEREAMKRPRGFAARLERRATAWGLTPRQREVAALVALGRTNKQIAAELACALHTVELHVTEVLRRAGVQGRTALVAAFWSEPLDDEP